MSIQPLAGIVLGAAFVLVAGLNVRWMLESSRPSCEPAVRARLIRRHRLFGYVFLGLYCGMLYVMNLRLLGNSDPLPFSLAMHAALALLVVPLLTAKIIVARRYKHLSTLLQVLGISLFATAFLIVALGVLPRLWDALGAYHASDAVSGGIFAAIVAGCATLLATRGRGAPPAAAGAANPSGKAPLVLRLSRVQAETPDTKTFRFLLPDGAALHPKPGQFMTFRWIIDGAPVVRSYSICSSPTQTAYIEIAVKRAANGLVSTFLNERAEVGLTVEARGPFGRFCFDENRHKKIVLIAGGSGITPMLSMLRSIDDRCLSTDVTLVFCVRTPEDVIFAKELGRLRGSMKRLRVVVAPSAAPQSWEGPVGRLGRETLRSAVSDWSGAAFFLCGPPGLMESAREILRSGGVADDLILQEKFGGPSAQAGPPAGPAGGRAVEFSRSGKTCTVVPAQTLLEAAEINHVPIPSSCRQGLCGTCAVRLLEGNVRMESEEGLTPERRAAGFVLTCVGHAEGDVKIDV